jgi:hypothetical protein
MTHGPTLLGNEVSPLREWPPVFAAKATWAEKAPGTKALRQDAAPAKKSKFTWDFFIWGYRSL